MLRFCTKSSSHSIYSFLDILVLITAYLLSFLGHPTKMVKSFRRSGSIYYRFMDIRRFGPVSPFSWKKARRRNKRRIRRDGDDDDDNDDGK